MIKQFFGLYKILSYILLISCVFCFTNVTKVNATFFGQCSFGSGNYGNCDITAPVINLTTFTPNPTSNKTPVFSGSVTDTIGTINKVEYQVDNTSGSWTDCIAEDGIFNESSEDFFCQTNTLLDGAHSIYIKATDSNGNITGSNNYASSTITIDATAPTAPGIPIVTIVANSFFQSWSFVASNDVTTGISYYSYRIIDSVGGLVSSGTNTTRVVVSNLLKGTYTFFVKAVDFVGNQSNEVSQTVTISDLNSLGTSQPEYNRTTSITSAPTCEDSEPGAKPPQLYAAIPNGNNAIDLFFTEADDPVSYYAVEFGLESGKYIFGNNSIGPKGTRTYTVNHLLPNTTYYFKVRAGNGCAPGPWSNELAVKTKKLFNFNSVTATISDVTNSIESGPSVEGAAIEKKEDLESYTLILTVLDKNKNKLNYVKILVDNNSQALYTNELGIIKIANLLKGEHLIRLDYQGNLSEIKVNLSGSIPEIALETTMNIQNFNFSITTIALYFGGIFVSILLCLYILRKK